MARTANIENEELKTTEIDMTEAEADEALKADMAANEVDYLAGLLNAAEDAEDETRRSRLSVMERLTLLFQFIRFRMRLCMKSVKSTPSM